MKYNKISSIKKQLLLAKMYLENKSNLNKLYLLRKKKEKLEREIKEYEKNIITW